MTRRTNSALVTAVASLMCSGLVLAQSGTQAPGQSSNQDTPGTSMQQRQGAGAVGSQAGQSQSGSMTASGSMSRTGGSQADQQIEEQLRKISQDPSTAADKLFVLKAACGNQFETELARAVQGKAQNPQVKQLAQQIMQDHQQANQQLETVARSLQMDLPDSLESTKQQEIQILTSLPADQLEKHYVVMMQADHAKDVTEYRAVSQMAKDAQVKQYASQTLPKLQQHAQHVTATAAALGLPSMGDAQTAGSRIEGSSGTSGSGTSQMRESSPNASGSNAGQSGSIGGVGSGSGSGSGATGSGQRTTGGGQ